MGKKGGKKHLKRKPAPKFWPIHRKEACWSVRPNPGPHSFFHSVPLTLALRATLKHARTAKEAKTIIAQGQIQVNGVLQREERFPLGLMDVLSIPKTEKNYRILPSKKGLILNPIGKDEAQFKLSRIENQVTVKGGNVQINLNDGTNVRVGSEDSPLLEERAYRTLDTLKLSLPNHEIIDHLKLKVGALAIIIGGKNLGQNGKITKIEEKKNQKRKDFLVTIEDNNGKSFQTILDFVFIIGDAENAISLLEAR